MLQFMISGYIPGTDTQLGFYEFLLAFSVAASLYFMYLLARERQLFQLLSVSFILRKYL
jgi:hypothetical protein